MASREFGSGRGRRDPGRRAFASHGGEFYLAAGFGLWNIGTSWQDASGRGAAELLPRRVTYFQEGAERPEGGSSGKGDL